MNRQGRRASFELLYSAKHHTERITVLREQEKKAGVELQLKMMQQGMFHAILNRKYQAWFGGMSTYYTPSYWQSFSSENAKHIPSNNFYGYSSEEMDRLLEIESGSTDIAVLAKNSKAIQRLVHKEALIIT